MQRWGAPSTRGHDARLQRLQAELAATEAALQAQLEADLAAIETSSQARLRALQQGAAQRGSSSGSDCFSASITSSDAFLGNSDEVFNLDDGSVWKVVVGEYNYLYRYYPRVKICRGSTLIVDDVNVSVYRVR